jgi:hypothetical protein
MSSPWISSLKISFEWIVSSSWTTSSKGRSRMPWKISKKRERRMSNSADRLLKRYCLCVHHLHQYTENEEDGIRTHL